MAKGKAKGGPGSPTPEERAAIEAFANAEVDRHAKELDVKEIKRLAVAADQCLAASNAAIAIRDFIRART